MGCNTSAGYFPWNDPSRMTAFLEPLAKSEDAQRKDRTGSHKAPVACGAPKGSCQENISESDDSPGLPY